MALQLSSSVLDELNTTEAKALHEITDKLSSCGVGKIVNLPQIIVVGGQSVGKSSVLEAMSRIRFPVYNDICTRFATELVLRQARQTRVDVSVRFDDTLKAPKTFQQTDFNENDLPDIITRAKECMGIAATGKEFSKDVLRLEIEGPNMYPLTLVDLPGIFHVETDQQSEQGRETVDKLVESYMKKTNSIILVVIPATSQLANHYSLRVVKQVDPQRERTLGVITKPDQTRPGSSDERNYIQLAKSQESTHKLKLGWHVLRNRAENEESLDDRDAIEEAFFKENEWASLFPEDCGIANLRRKLSTVLYKHIRENMHGVIGDIESKLRDRQAELGRLGRPRSRPEEMRSFLLTVADEFQRLARDGIHGCYNDQFFGDLDATENKLRALLRNFNRVFDHVLKTKGSALIIAPPDGTDPQPATTPEFLTQFRETYPYEFPDPTPITRSALSRRLEEQAAHNQGRELPGLPSRELVTKLFQRQAVPWKEIAQFHVRQVTLVAKAFVDQLFRYVIGPPDASPTTEAILRICVDKFFAEKERVLEAKLDELLRPYTRGYAMPLDADFQRTRLQRSNKQIVAAVDKLLQGHPNAPLSENWEERTRNVVQTVVTNDGSTLGSEFGTETVIDMMETYYEMSLRTFTDNVVNLAIEGCLVSDIPDILTPRKVNQMTNEELKELAAESDDAHSRRDRLEAEVAILREGLEQCRRYRPRGLTVIPSARSAAPVTVAPNNKGLAANASRAVISVPPAGAIAENPNASAKNRGKSASSRSLVPKDAAVVGGSTPKPATPSLFSLPSGPSPWVTSVAWLGNAGSSSNSSGSGSLFATKPAPGSSGFGSSLFAQTPSSETQTSASNDSSGGSVWSKGVSFCERFPNAWLEPSDLYLQHTEQERVSGVLLGNLQQYTHIGVSEDYRCYSPEEMRVAKYLGQPLRK